MRRFAETCEAVAASTKKNEKVRLVGEYLRSLPVEDAACAALFFSGRAFPRTQEKVMAVGGSLICSTWTASCCWICRSPSATADWKPCSAPPRGPPAPPRTGYSSSR